MSTIVPPPTPTQVPAAPTCREYLGASHGYCPEQTAAQVGDRPFCRAHATERQDYLRRMGGGA